MRGTTAAVPKVYLALSTLGAAAAVGVAALVYDELVDVVMDSGFPMLQRMFAKPIRRHHRRMSRMLDESQLSSMGPAIMAMLEPPLVLEPPIGLTGREAAADFIFERSPMVVKIPRERNGRSKHLAVLRSHYIWAGQALVDLYGVEAFDRPEYEELRHAWMISQYGTDA